MTKPKKSAVQKNQAVSMDDGEHMDVLMINALLHSLFTIFSTMVRLEIQAGLPVIKQGNIAKKHRKHRKGQALRLTFSI